MVESCDWTHIIENEGIGGVIVAVVWALWSWFKSRKTSS